MIGPSDRSFVLLKVLYGGFLLLSKVPLPLSNENETSTQKRIDVSFLISKAF
jgi:hypothetical protein